MKTSAEETDPYKVADYFHSLYKTFHVRKNERKQIQRRNKSHRPKLRQRTKISQQQYSCSVILPLEVPRIEILGNCSPFSAYASVRQLVLEVNFAEASKKWLTASEERDNENDNAAERLPSPVALPKVIGIGLEAVFQLIKESHSQHASLCVKALEALLNILGGQYPQSLKKEPIPVIDSLFSTLLNLTKCETSDIPSTSKAVAGGSATQQLTSVATACLISLAIARGDCKMMLEAISSLFMCNEELACQTFKSPDILKALQRSTQAILVGRPVLPQWLTHGIPSNSCVDFFSVPFSPDPPGCVFTAKCLATDGRYIFLHCSRGLYKIGSGTFGTERGKIYASDVNFHLSEKIWIGWASGKLFYRLVNCGDTSLKVLDENTFEVKESIKTLEDGSVTMFSDGVHIGAIVPSKDDGFVARTVWMETASMSWDSFFEVNLRLVKKSLEASGPCPWDNDSCIRPIITGIDDDVLSICAGKDFALLRTQHGRILYCGKGASLGQKSGITKCSKWLELGLTKCPRFTHCAVGHEGIHALLLSEDGTAYFVGTPKRGEDGDQAKPRRVAKASKPKKVIRMEGHDVVYVSCNNGTSGFVTRSGDVYMYGKDTAHCDPTTGFLGALRGVAVSSLAMGKAHCVLLSADGKVYTMGINNRGQCGRTWSPQKDGVADVLDEDDGEWDDAAGAGAVSTEQEGMCPAGTHRWKHEQCMICTICRECTGYGSACISALRPDRNPGQECGCGVGDAGCAECGSCRTCAREGIEEQDYVIIDAQRSLEPAGGELLQLEEERLGPLEDAPEKRSAKTTAKPSKSRGKENSMTSFPPSRLNLPTSHPITQVACGLHHSVFLDSNGSVFVCGSNSFGQLGLGDLSPRHIPTKIRFSDLDTKIIQIAAGSYHTVALDSNGVVYTCGSHTKGQLAREPEECKTDTFWFAKMTPLPVVGSKYGRRVTWISAAGDATFMKLEVSLISPQSLRKSTVTANLSAIMIIPPSTSSKSAAVIMINRKDGCCTYFDGEKNIGVTTSAATLDPVYDFLWTYEWRTHLMRCYNVVASAVRNPLVESNMWLAKPPFAIPVLPSATLQRWQAGANLLACMDSLVAANIQGLGVHHEEQAVVTVLSKMYSRDDYSAVCRFESHGGGWGYSGHSIEAVRFSSDSDVLLGGFGLFGGRGEYCAKIKVFDVGPEGGDVEGDGELLAETEEIPYECGPRQKFRMMFEDPIPLQAGRWYVAWAHIIGPSSDCGSSGQSLVVTEDQVTFHFKSSKKSNNGTDVNAGQIPQVLYRLMTSDQSTIGTKPKQQVEPTYLLTNDFISNFSPASIQTLLSLINWCWDEVQELCTFTKVNVFKAELMKFVACCALRFIEYSINQAYPPKGYSRLTQTESMPMAEAVGKVRSTLQSMMSCHIETKDSSLEPILEDILNQTCSTYVNCFQIFYPTCTLKWECLANFMHHYFESPLMYARILSAILEALSSCRGHLLSVFPVFNKIAFQNYEEFILPFGLDDESAKFKQPGNSKLLIYHMTARNEIEGFLKSTWSFWEVLENLLSIINVNNEASTQPLKALVHNSSMILARLMEEMVSHASGAYAELENVIGQTVVVTPCRFTRTNQSRTWNTGNGSPDAVCFTVDQQGVTVFGACIYSGTGNYEYELDLLQEVDETTVESLDPPNSKWNCLEGTRGSFDSDDSFGDVVEIKFPRPVHIKPNVKYALRLKNHGGRTCNGDGGISVLRCPDGTVFTFSSCSLSFNGTNQIRGQLPNILYFRNPEDSESRQKAKAVGEMQARKCAQKMSNIIFDSAKEIFLMSSLDGFYELPQCSLVTTLLPSIVAHLPRLAVSNLRSCVDILEQIRRILPLVSDLNNKLNSTKVTAETISDGVQFTWVESDHPYKPAAVSHYKVNFPPSVQIMTIEFDPRCSTAQPEDSLRLYIPRGVTNQEVPTNRRLSTTDSSSDDQDIYLSYVAILDKYSGRGNWPKKALVLPGNEVLFSLETASDYARADKNHYFGFRCLVSGFEVNHHQGLQRLEVELAYVGGLCAYELIKKELILPPVSGEEVEMNAESSAPDTKMMEICLKHQQLFAKGIGLEYFPDVQEALDGIVPLRGKSKEQEFIANFVSRTPNTSGERLANWLQPESFVDPQKCEIIIPQESIRRGKQVIFSIITRDQYAEPVVAHNLQVEVKAVPMMMSSDPSFVRSCASGYGKSLDLSFMQQFSGSISSLTNASMTSKSPDASVYYSRHGSIDKGAATRKPEGSGVPYQVTVKDKMRYHSITMMKEYENISFEELRLLSPMAFRSAESMSVRQSSNGNYTATWTPSCTGPYHLRVTVDGYPVSEAYVVEVDEGSEKSISTEKPADEVQETPDNQFLKKRKFKASDSAGLRIRSHPSLQSEQLGCIPINGVIGFTQEIHNDDGIWVKLDELSLYAYCESSHTRNFRLEGWCLQYNQHVGKTLLFPVEGPKRITNVEHQNKGVVNMRRLNDPSHCNTDNSSKILRLNGSPGLYQVVKCGVSGHNVRSRPCLRSPPVGILVMGSKFYVVDECFSNEGLWVKLDPSSQRRFCFTAEGEAWSLAVGHGDVTYLRHIESASTDKGYDFSVVSQVPPSIFRNVSPPAAFIGPADVHMPMEPRQGNLYRQTSSDNERDSGNEVMKGVQADEDNEMPEKSVEAPTPQEESPSSLPTSEKLERSISRKDSEGGDPPAKDKSGKSKSSTPLGALQKWFQMGTESRPSSGSYSKQATSVMEASKSLVKERIGAFSNPDRVKSAVPTTTCSATQTSPDEQNVLSSSFSSNVLHFNIGTSKAAAIPTGNVASVQEVRNAGTKLTPKSERKKRGVSRTRSAYRDRERLRSPPRPQVDSGNSFGTPILDVSYKEAIGPGEAQSVRAVFGAILWHCGIIHDAMACASYLRFITKESAHEVKEENVGEEEKDSVDTTANPEPPKTVPVAQQDVIRSPVVMRKKQNSPARNRGWQRHSLEVTTPARYLTETTHKPLVPLDSVSPIRPIGTDTQETAEKDSSSAPSTGAQDSNKQRLPFAITALEEVWRHVKDNCSDATFQDGMSPVVHPDTKGTKWSKDSGGYDRRYNPAHPVARNRSEKPYLQTAGKTFLLDTVENQQKGDMQQCEMCQCMYKPKSKSRKAHFDLSFLCENCSERQLKIKKRQHGLAKNISPQSSNEVKIQNTSVETNLYSHSSLLNNALFLLQMTNAVQESQTQLRSSPIIQKYGFSCLQSLGASDSQILDDDDNFFDPIAPVEVKMRDVDEARLSREKRSVSAASTSFTEEDWDPITKRRKASNGDQISDEAAGYNLLNHPSFPLQKLLVSTSSGTSSPETEAIRKMCKAVLSFVSEHHDLDGLKLYLFQAIRRVTCRSYGMKILAWLMRNVSQPTALHDVLWWYASSLESKGDDFTDGKAGLDNGWWQMRYHPLSESLASIFTLLSESFYALMQTVADIMPFLPIGSPLLEMAVKCWGVCFTRKDHGFLHKSKIFRNLSKIMSQFDGEGEWSKTSMAFQFDPQESLVGCQITTCLSDLTPAMEMKASSRAALCSSLTDESTETFWESGDEDRNRTKNITIVSSCDAIISVISVFVDNGRDTQYKVSSVTVKVGAHSDECSKIGHLELDSRHCGWCWFPLKQDNVKVIKIELKGPDNTLRIRQVKILGTLTGDVPSTDKGLERFHAQTFMIAQRKCENETLRIFRLLSSEVFGKFLYGMKHGESDADGNDLQEHVVGILFSRNKLTHLQKQVCSHIVAAIHREAIKIKEEVDSQLTGSVLEATNENIRIISAEKPRIPDRYCFEMLTLVLALADHKLGRSYLSQQSNLIQDLMQLFHSGTPRIQRQVIAVIRKILPEIKPEDFAKIVCLQDSSTGEVKLGVLDMFFGCVLKSLQVKVRGSQDGNRSAKNICINDILITEELPSYYWFFKGDGDSQLASSVVSLIKDMCEPQFSSVWAPVTKSAIGDAVLYLTKVDEKSRNAAGCLNCPRFWISLAALSTLHVDHSKLLSSPVFMNGSSGRTKCINHDDGETLAVIQCHDCGDLCTECDRILHLPKRQWAHVRKVCKEEEESIKVDLHEGCGRIKLFWLMALVDSSTLKALVEFRNGMPKAVTESTSVLTAVGRCRFCNKIGNSGPLALGNVCGDVECQEYSKIACERILECGHLCGGVRNETKCLPCLQGCSDKLGTILKQDGDDMCMICFTDALAFAPAIQLSCGHVFHYQCCRSILESRWAGPRITFSFSFCPICKVQMCHALLDEVLLPIRELFEDVQRKALMRLEYEGLNQADEIASPGGRYFKDPAGFAMDRYAYYVCFKCKKAYFGGEVRCDVEVQLEFDPTELLCGGCSDVSQAQLCPKHGTDYLEYKCRYCCSVAVFFCFGTTHFCNGCHDDFQRITAIPKHQLPHCPAGPRARQLEGEECPLHVSHPPTGEEFALGCGICRNAHTF